MPTLDAAPPRNPLEGLYGFVRAHLLIFNNVALASATLVGALDFLAPRLALAPVVVYSMTACLALLMISAAAAPAFVGRMLAALGIGPAGSLPLWRRPAWQVGLAFLVGVTAIGWASVAKASQGGLIASQFPAARGLQESLLGLRHDLVAVQRGVDDANGKLDLLVGDSRDPQRELAARGFPLDDGGLVKAIRLGDRRAAGLYVAAGYRARWQSPMGNILNGPQPWDGELVALLPPSMFAAKSACDQAGLILYEIKPPAAERLAAFKRLCDPAPWIARLRREIEIDQRTPAPNEQWRKMREARQFNLAQLTR